ncbi:MAG: glycosyltransferase family 2 protein [Gemmatimonadetes bacterium]|nr:glycosyltransferase family 2 protein [Gemmatimonadota bacterium]MBI3504621.1 glycosyltransferase family 2 protein [Pseudomonadota bacterium]
MRASLLVSTYNWKDALAALLATVRAQREPPLEVLVADDGSRDDTAALIASEAATFPVPLRHFWQEDLGFRKSRILNEALVHARGEYVIQIDGDMLLHRDFVRDHVRFARPGFFLQGSRVLLGDDATRRSIAARAIAASALSRDVRNRVNSVRAPWLTRFVRGPRDPLVGIRGCNMSFWMSDLTAVNGYDEDIEGWGREDSELAARLLNAGVRRRNIKFSALAWHLEHDTRSQDALDRNHAIFERVAREQRRRCEHGLSGHHVPPSGAP